MNFSELFGRLTAKLTKFDRVVIVISCLIYLIGFVHYLIWAKLTIGEFFSNKFSSGEFLLEYNLAMLGVIIYKIRVFLFYSTCWKCRQYTGCRST